MHLFTDIIFFIKSMMCKKIKSTAAFEKVIIKKHFKITDEIGNEKTCP